MEIKTFFSLIRINQWYKNLVIYLALIFSIMLFDFNLLILTTIGFFSLCFVSSANYIINDIIDVNKDKNHPEKSKRPIASGKVSVNFALIIALVLFLISLLIALKLSFGFFIFNLILFFLTLLYSLFLKNVLFLDILIVASNFVIRAVSGIFIIKSEVSPWLVLCPFFLAMFLIVGKRKADLEFLKTNAQLHKKVLKYYTKEITDALLIISTTLLIISYSLYAFLNLHKYLLATIPFSIFVVLRYFYLIYSNSEIARKPNLFYKDKQLLIGILLWVIAIFLLLYFFKL